MRPLLASGVGTTILSYLSVLAMCSLGYAEDKRSLPSTPQFMNMLNTCAAGSRTQFQGDLLGSIRDIYEGQRARGFAQLRTETDFMRLLPETQKLEGYRIYVECIKAILNDPEASKARVQFAFLAGYRADTPMEKVVETFGQPAKVKQLYNDGSRITHRGSSVELRWFEGVNSDFFVAVTRAGSVLGAGVLGKKDPKQARLPYLSMGKQVGNRERLYSTLADFNFADMGHLCQEQKTTGTHARFSYMTTPLCYFGAPGGYMHYEFVFQPTSAIISACRNVDWYQDMEFSRLPCAPLKALKPVFGFIYFDERALPQGVSDIIMEWIYNFAQ